MNDLNASEFAAVLDGLTVLSHNYHVASMFDEKAVVDLAYAKIVNGVVGR